MANEQAKRLMAGGKEPTGKAGIKGHRRFDPDRIIRAPRGSDLNTCSWQVEAPLRMLMNNLDPEVAEHPEQLVVYGGIGRAARDWDCYHQIVATLKRLQTVNGLPTDIGHQGALAWPG